MQAANNFNGVSPQASIARIQQLVQSGSISLATAQQWIAQLTNNNLRQQQQKQQMMNQPMQQRVSITKKKKSFYYQIIKSIYYIRWVIICQ
jgi:hypothetical protein